MPTLETGMAPALGYIMKQSCFRMGRVPQVCANAPPPPQVSGLLCYRRAERPETLEEAQSETRTGVAGLLSTGAIFPTNPKPRGYSAMYKSTRLQMINQPLQPLYPW